MRITIEFNDEESARKFTENVNRDGVCMTYDEGALGGVSQDERSHHIKIVECDLQNRISGQVHGVSIQARDIVGGIDFRG